MNRNGVASSRRLLPTLVTAAALAAAAAVGPAASAVGPAASGAPATTTPTSNPATGPATPSATSPAKQAPDGPAPSSGAAGIAPGDYRVTLLTGDVVALHVTADGRQNASLVNAPRGDTGREPRIVEQDGDVHVVPAEVTPYLASGALDDRLFNVTSLVRQGYHDAATKQLPLVVDTPEGPSTFSAPNGARVERRLPSVDAVSMVADKDTARSVWQHLRGPAPMVDDGATAELAGADRVWLNGRVEAALDESVPQVGAPQAWEAGFDGTGVDVAVLDSGYDPDHPDLRGQVVGSEDFTAGDGTDTVVDGNGHGTHVASTIAGTGAASDGRLRGVAPGADLLVGKVLDDSGSGYEAEIIAAMEWAVEQGADVVNMSIGSRLASDGTDPLSLAVDRLTASSGVLFVVAAGNSGPAEGTVGSPGAADVALTVGAVDKSDQPAWFSSRGPRIGDGAIKPEIVAPGVGIVAARAGGTSLGNLIDEHYTSLNGTSMATPHVAGAAAVLAQRHEDWDAGELKARLVSSSEPLDGEPISFQGAGRLDVSAALRESVTVGSGSLSVGRIPHDGDATTSSLTYTNPTDSRVTLRLSADLSRVGPDGSGRPLVRFSPRVLSIPAGGSATAEVRVSPNGAVPGEYEGHVVARDVRGRAPITRTVASAVIVPPSHTLTVEAVDAHGQPAGGPVEVVNIDTWEHRRVFLSDGEVSVEVPEGDYSVMTAIRTPAVGDATAGLTVAGEPELEIDEDVSLNYDVREAEPMTVETPRKTLMDNVELLWRRSIGSETLTSKLTAGANGDRLSVLPSDGAETGEFALWTGWHLVEPLMTVGIPDGTGGSSVVTPLLATTGHPYVGDKQLRVVDVGAGTPADFERADVEGAVALADRPADGDLFSISEAAAAAGAELLVVASDRPGVWSTTAWPSTFPTYTVRRSTGAALRSALAADPDARVDMSAIPDSTYSYELFLNESGALPAGKVYDAAELPLATVESDYHEDAADQGRRESWVPFLDGTTVGMTLSTWRNGPVQRTEYVSTEGVEWRRFGQPHGMFLNMYWTNSQVRSYEAGETYHQQWWGPLVRPGVPAITGSQRRGMPVARFTDAIRISMPHYRYGNGTLHGSIQQQLGDVSELTLRRDGELVGRSDWSEAQYTVPPGDAQYALRLQVDSGSRNWKETSVATDTTWRFRSQRTGEERTVLPLVQADYELDTGAYNQVPVGESYPLVVGPEYQPEATGPGGFDTSVEVSFDDGASWTEVPVEAVGEGRFAATVPASPEPGFATVRVTVTDADGNSMTQRIDRAWRIGMPG
ncbi:S8 family peptidase [Haloactinopolyspora alba]|uniref:S8 family peptidase n=1 Tax=Haloactinopolyspora alba TaxID=648780 RepID=UPI0013EA0FF1|nr:S8 family peptidase [Haloactinopolyspora alba]